MKLPRIRNRFLLNGARLAALAALVAVAGVIGGLALGVPLGRINFASSDAVRLDQARLAGSVDPAAVLTTTADLPVGWKEGDAALAGFGILANQFCGETVDMPPALSESKAAVFVNEAGNATVISQAVRLEQWQDAREYVRNVDRVVGDCDKFFQVDPEGKRLRVDVKAGQGDAPITDFVSRTFVAEDGSSVQAWSIMAIGDVIVGLRHIGKAAPQHSFMTDLQNHILMRGAPQVFAPGSTETEANPTDTTVPGETTTTVLDSGSPEEPADTTVDQPETPGGGQGRGTVVDDGGASGDEPRD